mmetsp:Transcript_9650/g.9328  ORF Transcript_9650/g.9328 Transcript_9650/m.9328 type:complete len:111 (-) Transcript_9650:730-1062(-)
MKGVNRGHTSNYGLLGYAQINSKNVVLEVVGQKCSLKYEKKLDKLAKTAMATLFIQRIWRGHYARKYLKLDKISQLLTKKRKKNALNLIFDTLTLINTRIKMEDILFFSF